MYVQRRRHGWWQLAALVPIAVLVSMTLPVPVRACLPYSVSEFSFKGSLELAIVGRVTAVVDDANQQHATITVEVDTLLAGAPSETIVVGMDPEGGCDHPKGDLGDQVVIAAGDPGASIAWDGGPLSPYNSATWVISDGAVAAGPFLDGRKPSTLADLLETLRSMPSGSLPVPAGPLATSLFGSVAVVAILIVLIKRRRSSG